MSISVGKKDKEKASPLSGWRGFRRCGEKSPYKKERVGLLLVGSAFAFILYETDQRSSFKNQTDCVAYAEGDCEEFCMLGVGKEVYRQHHDMQKQHSYHRPEEYLDESLWRAVHGPSDQPVLQAAHDAEVQGQQRHDRDIIVRSEPHDAESSQHHCQSHQEQGEQVAAHHSANFRVSLVVYFSQ